MAVRFTCVTENTAGRPNLRAEHGLAVYVETSGGAVLWDTGASGEALSHNLRALGLEGAPIDAVGLSHAHGDHTGGLGKLLEMRPGLDIYAHEDIGRIRFSVRSVATATGMLLRLDALAEVATLHLSEGPQEVLPGIWTTGTIAPRPYPLGGEPHLKVLEAGALVDDPYADDMSLVVDLGQSIALLCGCCHAGLRNTIATVRRRFPQPLAAVIGGTHLRSAPPDEVDAIAELLRAEHVPHVRLNHCTGDKAVARLAAALGERVGPFPAGATLEV